jgi:hypothetical protein
MGQKNLLKKFYILRHNEYILRPNEQNFQSQ